MYKPIPRELSDPKSLISYSLSGLAYPQLGVRIPAWVLPIESRAVSIGAICRGLDASNLRFSTSTKEILLVHPSLLSRHSRFFIAAPKGFNFPFFIHGIFNWA